jgi:hypothetical protein
MKALKYPEDFKDWKTLYIMHDKKYLVIESPDGTMDACIHLEDNEVVGIRIKATDEYIYDGNLVLARKLGLKL